MVLHVVSTEKIGHFEGILSAESVQSISAPLSSTLCLEGEDMGEAISEKSPDFCVLPFLLYCCVI